jgi:DNA repair protein RecO (recombination protein O)
MLAPDLQPAYALHSRRYRESSLIVDFLTRDHGRIALLAKGAIGSKHARQNLLQPFSPLLIAWRGRGELPTLTTLEPASHVQQVVGTTLFCGLYVNELVLKLTERNESHSDLFPVYAACMQDLLEADNQTAGLETALRKFEVRLLDELGLGMSLTEDQQGIPVQPGEHYHYDFLAGPTVCLADDTSVAGETLIALARGDFQSAEQRREARRLMRRVLAHHLGGRSLKSRELFRGTGKISRDG